MTTKIPVLKQLLKIRDALIAEDTDRAYALLYEMAEGIKGRPWERWERIVSGDVEGMVEVKLTTRAEA